MKSASLIAAVLFCTATICPAQEPAKPAAETPAPAAAETAKSAQPQLDKAPADSYIIGPSDVIAVTVFKEPNLSGALLVRPDGMISISLLGDVKAAGKTPLQLSDEITEKLKAYIHDPNVTVVLNQNNSKIVYLMGEVSKPGPLAMTPGMTLLQAIATSGGLTLYANAKKIYILRSSNGKQEKIPVQYKQALKGDGSLNLTLNAGDTIVVP